MRMVVIRAISAALIAISVAILPVAGEAAVSGKPAEMSMSDNTNMPCCPRCSAQDDFKRSGACAIKCMSYFSAILPVIVSLAHVVDEAPPSFADGELRGHVQSPPTHPPPV